MNSLDLLTLLVAFFSLVVSTFTYYQNYRVNSFDFSAMENTKKDFLQIIASLSLIAEKYTYTSYLKVDFEEEKKHVWDFVTSDTWVILRNLLDAEETDQLFLLCSNFQILLSDGKCNGKTACILLEQMEDAYRKYYKKIVAEKKYMRKHIGSLFANTKYIQKWYQQNDIQEKNQQQNLLNKFKYIQKTLKEKDPNIDMWIGVLENNLSKIKSAVKNGANKFCTSSQLLEKYKDL